MRKFNMQTRGSEFSIYWYSHYGGYHETMARRIQGILSSVEGA